MMALAIMACMLALPMNAFARKGKEHFNKDHVIPRQLGTFEYNQTLIYTVCSSCNR